ncbi:MAG: hypothetical protein QOH36_41 [Actinomycetota bacterium]|nr:hypothetical protein [Actinomycetota bacterium]
MGIENRPVGVAVVGAGYWGQNLVRNFAACESSDLVVVADLSVERARKAVGSRSVRVTTDLSDVLDDPRVEAVAVATPVSTHLPIGLACLEAGKHLLMEKPLAATLADARKLVEVAEANDLVLMCDHTFCYSSAVRKIRQLVREGVVGEIQYFDSIRINLGLIQQDCDVFWDLGPHDLSVLDFILPPTCRPTGVIAHAADPLGMGHPSVGYLTLPLSSGGIAHISLNWLSPTKIRTTIVGGSRRMLVWDDLDPHYQLRMYDKGVETRTELDDRQRREVLVSYRTGDMVAPALELVEPLSRVAQELADSIRGHRQPATSGRAGLRVVTMLEAARRSLETGGALVPLGGESDGDR